MHEDCSLLSTFIRTFPTNIALMKNIFTLPLLSLLSYSMVSAQPGAKITATASRRIGASDAQYDGANARYTVYDTTRFFFSGTRHRGSSYYDFGDADSVHLYGVDPATGIATLGGTWLQTLDAAGNVIAAHQTTNDGTGVFIPLRRSFYTYDAAGNLLSSTREEYDGPTGMYEGYSRELHTYTGGRLTETVGQFFDAPSSTYVNSNRETFTYDAAGVLTGRELLYWAAGTWEPSTRYTFTNNAAGFPTTELTEVYVSGSATYQNWFRTLVTYDASARETERIEQAWNSSAGAWENDDRYQTSYTGAQKTDYYWSQWVGTTGSGSWEPEDRTTYTYDAAGNNTFVTDYNWRAATSTWAPTARTVMTYNSFGQVLESRREKWEFAVSDFQVVNGGNRNLYSYETYEDVSSTGRVASDLPLSVYPVPAGRMLYVSTGIGNAAGKATLVSGSGVVVRQQALDGGRVAIPVEGLPAGVYLLTVQTAGGKASRQVATGSLH